MSKMITDSKNYEDIADAIRAKNASSDTYEPGDMAQAIDDLPTGGTDNPYIEITGVTANGETTSVIFHNYNENTGKTKIDKYQFMDNNTLTSITGLENITSVGIQAFSTIRSTNLYIPAHRIELPKCTIFEKSAFAYRTAKTAGDIRILINPKIITNIGDSAFYNTLTSQEIDRGIKLIPTEIILDDDDNTVWNFDELISLGSNAFYGVKAETFWDSVIKIPKIISVASSAFRGCKMISFEGDQINSVGSNAFTNCDLLENFKAPNLTGISSNAFNRATALRKIWIKDGGNITGSNNSNCPFLNCDSSLEIYTDAESKPSSWGSYFDVVGTSASTRATVHYGTTYQDFLDA